MADHSGGEGLAGGASRQLKMQNYQRSATK
jgi:hypothetical protein